MRLRSFSCLMLLFLVGACSSAAPRRPEFSGGLPIFDCPESLQGQVRLSVEARPIAVQQLDSSGANSIPTVGSVARRVSVAVVPAGLQPEDRIVWSSLALNSFGGTFAGWARLQTDHVSLAGPGEIQATAATNRNARSQRAEVLAVASAPGQIKVTRSARGKTDLMGSLSVDVFAMPGGVVVDDTVLRIPQLWTKEGAPISPQEVALELSPIRHPPGYDIVRASAVLDFVVRQARSGDEWSCSAETSITLVDQDAIRQPFWDLGLAASNAGRKEWLAFFEPSVGAVRAVFASPAAANALVSWIEATGAIAIGPYSLGAFQQSATKVGRPFGVLDADAMRTFRPLTARDLRTIRIGPVGEP